MFISRLFSCGPPREPEGFSADLDAWVAAVPQGGQRAVAARLMRDCVRRGSDDLDLSGLGLTSLPECIGQLGHLKRLRLYDNGLTRLPDSLGDLSALETLLVSGNRLVGLPESFGRLTNLRWCVMSCNQLVSLPESIGQLGRLRKLALHDNAFEAVPEGLLQLQVGARAVREALNELAGVAQRRFEAGELSGLQPLMGELAKWSRIAQCQTPPDRALVAQVNFHLGTMMRQAQPTTPGPAVQRFALALEMALAAQFPDEVLTQYARALLEAAGPGVASFNIGGVSTPRDEIQALANPEAGEGLHAALNRIYAQIRHEGWAPNVHLGGFLLQGAALLSEMQRRIRGPICTPEAASAAIEAQLDMRAAQEHEAIRAGLAHCLALPTPVDEGGLRCTVPEALCVLWSYIDTRDEGALREQLTDAYLARLYEIGVEQPCNTGCVQRLLQTPEGIDLSLVTTQPSDGALREMIVSRASEVWNEFESEQNAYRFDFNGEEPDPEALIKLRQDVIRAAVEARFVGFKALPREAVEAQLEPVLEMVRYL